MAEVALAFLWHQHQPYYPDDVGGENPMPWVRLHGVKDYYGMALHLLEFPEMHCTINLVPSLVRQLQAYAEHDATDQYLLLSRKPADGLTESDCLFLLDHFFMANPEHMILPHRRYGELYQRRGANRNTAREALRRFQERDLRDLQVWFNLTWIHPLAFERDADLRELRDKGRHFTEDEKNWLLDKHREILRAVLPLHRQLADRGQVELTTTPYYHPILPLLFDKKLAREALPDVKLPRFASGYPEDAAVHVNRAVDQHARIFGKPPKGMWPAEGSVCQSMLPVLAQHGIRWIATDEGILSASTHGFVSRDSRGHARNPDQMYRPYKVAEAGHELGIVFRDHALSDMIGFHYQRSDPQAAAADFIQHLHGIGRAVTGSQPALVSVILDGENCWEHYPGGGVGFLRCLYECCVRTRDIQPVQIGAFLEKHPPRDTLPRLFAGSWISHNFAIWIGHEEDNTAWDALHQAREHLRQRAQQEHIPAEQVRKAWEELYIAEGSDWFWWFGDDHSSAQDALFDYLFRKHLKNIYLLLGDTPPAELARPISRRGQRALHTVPRSFLDVKIDGRRTFFEWLSAGRYTCQNERGTMAMVTRGPIKEVYFGFNPTALLIRVDFDRPARVALADFDSLRVGFTEPAGYEVRVTELRGGQPKAQLLKHGTEEGEKGRKGEGEKGRTESKEKDSRAPSVSPSPLLPFSPSPGKVGVGIDQIVELAIPFERLGVEVDQPIHFFIELLEGSQSRDRAPREGTINLTCPSPDFEQIMWDV
jgi:alpha-amylase/alpha-mannosidase (GH57 family)